ncbi:MAG: hypothetical protein V3S24_14820 [Candidatus Tectomicrobia bacterium]
MPNHPISVRLIEDNPTDVCSRITSAMRPATLIAGIDRVTQVQRLRGVLLQEGRWPD